MAESNQKKSQKKFKGKKWILFLILIFFWWFNNYSLKINSTSIKSAKISQPVRLAVLSDYHAHGLSISNETILRKLEKISPDAVLILGDMYSRNSGESEINMAVELMAAIAAEYTAYFVAGEHDTSQAYFSSLSENGVHVLNYAEETVDIKGNHIRFLGIDNAYYSPTFDLNNEFTLYGDSYNILLAHIPNYEKFADFGADLTLCADTHGGMFRLPFIGPVYDTQTRIKFPNLKNTGIPVYDKGWFDYQGGSMFITSGVGDSPYPVRFFNRPEIVCLDILPSEVTE